MDKKLLDILVCPCCLGPVRYMEEHNELWCQTEALAFPIEHDIPIMLEDRARKIPPKELRGG